MSQYAGKTHDELSKIHVVIDEPPGQLQYRY